MSQTKFDKLKVNDITLNHATRKIAKGVPVAHIADAATATTAAAAIGAADTDPSAAKLTDVQALQAKFNTLRTEKIASDVLINKLIDALEAYGIALPS